MECSDTAGHSLVLPSLSSQKGQASKESHFLASLPNDQL